MKLTSALGTESAEPNSAPTRLTPDALAAYCNVKQYAWRADCLTPDEEETAMREKTDDLPVAMEQQGFRLLSPGTWGGMVVEYFECTERIDLRPMLEGLPDDKCTCPHWGYMLRGAFHSQYADGTEEVIRSGDVCHMPAGHTGWFEAGSAMIFFSPEAEQRVIAEHFTKKMQG